MNTIEPPLATDQELADGQEIMRLVSEGKRVTERADQARRAMLERHGVMNIAVDLLRECQDADRWMSTTQASA